MTHLKIGDKAPDFKGLDEKGKEISLKDFNGSKLVVYFYPRDNTPTCTVESCNLRDNYEALLGQGIKVLGVSADTAKKHQNFINKFNLPFPLLADTEKETIKAFGVWGPKKFMGKSYEGIIRTTFVISEDGIILDIIDKVKAKSHTDQILEGLKNK